MRTRNADEFSRFFLLEVSFFCFMFFYVLYFLSLVFHHLRERDQILCAYSSFVIELALESS